MIEEAAAAEKQLRESLPIVSRLCEEEAVLESRLLDQ